MINSKVNKSPMATKGCSDSLYSHLQPFNCNMQQNLKVANAAITTDNQTCRGHWFEFLRVKIIRTQEYAT